MESPVTSVGSTVGNFRVLAVTPLPEQRAVAVLYEHPVSGAKLLHLAADDLENLFAVAFRTPPPDDTGLPHILEHTVLCGSRRFPVKDPFVELLKTSLATFLNAFTWPDRTIYPCASMNERDFLNLVRVYADAAFEPLLTEAHFKQEGHHFTFATPGDPATPLTIQGIVYNEMKGAYADLDGVIDREVARALFPDNAYGRDSGGDPDAIPSLTYEKFVDFHRRYYHPSNAFFFLYGKLPPAPVLELLDREYLAGRPAIAVDTAIAPQPRWNAPRGKTVPYPVDPGDADRAKAAVLVAWMTNDLRDTVATLAMNILYAYLLDHSASPLRKALIDSGLGEELTDSGYATHQRDTFFQVGLKGVDAARLHELAPRIEKLVLDTCAAETERGLDPELLDAAFHQCEIGVRKIGANHPLSLMGRVYGQWLYDAPPWTALEVGKQLDELRRRRAESPGYFADLLREQLVDNPHRVRFAFPPDPALAAREAAAFATRMEQEKARRGPDELARLAARAVQLEEEQERPNSPEALATLPRLARGDVPEEPPPLSTAREDAGDRPFIRADVFANGLAYFDLHLDLPVGAPGGLAPELLDYLPLYTECFGKMGAAGLDYAALARREAAVAGALSASAGGYLSLDDPERPRLGLRLHLSGLERNWPEALDVLADRWKKLDLDDRARLKDIVLQMRVAARDGVVASGHTYAGLAAAAAVRPAAALTERLDGIRQIRFIDKLADEFDARAAEVREKLGLIRDFIATGAAGGAASFVGDDEVHAHTRDWLARHPAAGPAGQGADGLAVLLNESLCRADGSDVSDAGAAPPRVGWLTATDVAFVAQAVPAPGHDDPLAPALLLLSGQLSYGYLWNELRVKGGAYGARAAYDPLGGVFTLSSYRDPAVFRTLAAYAGIGPYVAESMDLSAGGLEQAIIGSVKRLDAPWRPGQACATVLARQLSGATDARRREHRRRLLNLDADTVRRASALCFGATGEVLARAPVVVIGGRGKLESENAAAGDNALELKVL